MSYNDPNQYQQGYNQPQYSQQQQYGQPSHQGYSQYEQQQPGYGQQAAYQQQQYPSSGHVPISGAAQQSTAPETSDSGSYRNIRWTVKHRTTNSILNLELGQGDAINSKPGAMIHMSPSVTLKGQIKVSMKKLFTGAQMDTSTFTGPGVVALAPTLFGDIITLPIQPGQVWNVGKNAYLASTSEVVKNTKSQGLGKAFFSGEDLFVYRFEGNGVAWLTSYGAIETKHIQQGEQHIVDNGHLVAWNCEYKIERAGGGTWSSMKTGEGLVCRFTGPGTVYIQTRNLDDFADWVRSQVPNS